MSRVVFKFLSYFAAVFAVDQIIKWIFLNGFRYKSEFIDLILVYNKGVAFSMFSFLGENLKYIQLALIAVLLGYLFGQKELLRSHSAAFGLLLGGGCSNILDRFVHGGVVDYIFWHKWFNFAVFNFADMMIDLAIVIILIQSFLYRKK
ncbi:signal peptidase II [Campylobacter hyointestinalis]|uniref:Lipoprotein signal peptidase n=2 Tax=Campylobacter hyointestinalis TaxID=198 RepID=A0AAV6EIF6_CAMHY|nr:signal peptidase II [Campylobacter hyointestinalis]ANE33414.1 prolipoprotein signal peptidase II [Campylobacter hyointestinalis subsp. lawsonii CCUG 27631]KAB0613694.1 lipoprotein signal peptidase [Campylobacter hyointestinalis subsp. lawsonii]PPB56583.1 signal peptidase II [Campylobacter hyointestinalis subsp. hyointestinalis]QKF68635.1 prolipoprotein signal peptidase II [Campylobacter hyointestinalis subsp. lawsonii]RAZ24528.1 lipoprotein signal peptidase [Campylobacter hyointestinalis su